MRKKIQAFIMGLNEWEVDITSSFDEPLINYYDMGRNLGEKLHNKREPV
jgi:hypothetical protein